MSVKQVIIAEKEGEDALRWEPESILSSLLFWINPELARDYTMVFQLSWLCPWLCHVGKRLQKWQITGLRKEMLSFHVNTSCKDASWCLVGVTSCIFEETDSPLSFLHYVALQKWELASGSPPQHRCAPTMAVMKTALLNIFFDRMFQGAWVHIALLCFHSTP